MARDWELASRWQRLGAYLLDLLILVAVVVVLVMPLAYYFEDLELSERGYEMAALVIGLFAFLAMNWHLLVTRGQTVGKKIVGIHMVDYKTQTVPPISRVLTFRFLPFWLLGFVPVLGDIILIIDALFIFGMEKRCLHDLMAGTMVIRKPKWQPSAEPSPPKRE